MASICFQKIPSFTIKDTESYPPQTISSFTTFFLDLVSMKFGKRLKHHTQQSLPEWRDKFLSYKEMKKIVKLISAGASERGKVAESEFVSLLNTEIEKFNAFFMEQEEDFVIRQKELPRRIQEVIDKWGPNGTEPSESVNKTELAKIRNDVVNFHGEMILLINYSNINYTGLAKILKKYDKRTGGVLRRPFIQKVLKQPFFRTDLISKLVKECETTIESVFPPCGEEGTLKLRRQTQGTANVGDGVLRNTVAALLTMQEMRRVSSTYSHFSLPPLNLPDFDDIKWLEVRSPMQIP